MIITVTMNPAIDKTVKVKHIEIGGLNRLEVMKIEIGGKGLNVARTVAKLGHQVLPITFIPSSNYQQVEAALKAITLHYQTVTIGQPIRTNLKVITDDHKVTEFNESGPLVSSAELAEITNKILDNICHGDWLVLTGSVPRGVGREFYHDLIIKAHSKQVKVILDADDELFRIGLECVPEVIKPNRYELEKLYNISNATVEQLTNIAKELVHKGIELVVISLGAQGVIFANSEETLLAEALEFTPKSTVGAGDAMVGALAVGLIENYNMRKLAAFCTASAAVNCGLLADYGNYNSNVTNLSNKVIVKKLI